MVYRGNILIAANHPSLLETFIIPMITWPWSAYLKMFIWSVPDEQLFLKNFRWVYPYFKCIPVKRCKDAKNTSSTKQIIKTLKNGETVVIHPGGGRDCKGTLVKKGNRSIRAIDNSLIVRIATAADASILPLYIEFQGVTRPQGFLEGFRWLLKGNRMTFYVGDPYKPELKPQTTQAVKEANKILEQKILNA